jgi:fluoride ion exporter CrcB/FEX
MNSAFNLTAAVIMGALAAGALWLAPASAHDICLAVVAGLTGALTGAAARRQPPQA